MSLRALFGFLVLGYSIPAAAQDCTPPAPLGPVPAMTVVIRNNSKDYDLYPVIESGPGAIDTWMQAYFQVRQADLDKYKFSRDAIYRIFVNPAKGIGPGTAVTVTLPLFTQLAPKCIDAAGTGQFIDWWQGGRLNVFAALHASGKPPAALTAEYSSSTHPIKTAKFLPTCSDCTLLAVYASDAGVLPNNEPTQVSEWTFGANIVNPKATPSDAYYLLDTKNVDFDVSYVNNAYLPLAMEAYIAKDDPQYFNYPGYIGTVQGIGAVRTALEKFLGLGGTPRGRFYRGWPQYTQSLGGVETTHLKVPSPLELFATMQNTDSSCGESCDDFVAATIFTPTPQPPNGRPLKPKDLWPPIADLVTQWQSCTNGTADTRPMCQDLRDMKALFEDNYKTYTSLYGQKGSPCEQGAGPTPLNLSTLLAHVYGWTQFNAGCAADWNLLYGSPIGKDGKPKYPNLPARADYQKYKARFDVLNLDAALPFNPYVQLIHGKEFMNASSAYAFSVDDALGNMQAYGTGVILSLGDKANGFPNPKPAELPVNFNYGFASTNARNFEAYAVCNDSRFIADNPNFHSITVWRNPIGRCPIWLRDNQRNKYSVTITRPPPYPRELTCAIPGLGATNCKDDPKGTKYIDCSANAGGPGKTWCNQPGGITVQTMVDGEGHQSHNVVAGGPPQPGPYDPATQFAVFLGAPGPGDPQWKDYSVCTDNGKFTPLGKNYSFVVTATPASLKYPCTITVRSSSPDGAKLTDYQFTVLKPVDKWLPFKPGKSSHDPQVLSCSANPKDTCWCPYLVETSNATTRTLNSRTPGCLQ